MLSAMNVHSPKVLIVDDETEIGDLLAYALEFAGFDVNVVTDGASALSATRSWEPDIVVLDVMLPDADGFTLFARLRAVTDRPIVFLTARGRAYERERGLRLGASDYITKPFDIDDLIVRLRSVLSRS
jgi:two-component system OmpR family response regulator